MVTRGFGKTAVVAALLTAATSSQVTSVVYRDGAAFSAALAEQLPGMQGLLTTASKRSGVYQYNTATVPLLAEALKFLISSGILRHHMAYMPDAVQTTKGLRASLPFLVPSIIYWLHNNVQFVTLKFLEPATYQVLGNLKIVTTGVLFWLLLHRRLTVLQWLALALLTVGAMTSQVRDNCAIPAGCYAMPLCTLACCRPACSVSPGVQVNPGEQGASTFAAPTQVGPSAVKRKDSWSPVQQPRAGA